MNAQKLYKNLFKKPGKWKKVLVQENGKIDTYTQFMTCQRSFFEPWNNVIRIVVKTPNINNTDLYTPKPFQEKYLNKKLDIIEEKFLPMNVADILSEMIKNPNTWIPVRRIEAGGQETTETFLMNKEYPEGTLIERRIEDQYGISDTYKSHSFLGRFENSEFKLL